MRKKTLREKQVMEALRSQVPVEHLREVDSFFDDYFSESTLRRVDDDNEASILFIALRELKIDSVLTVKNLCEEIYAWTGKKRSPQEISKILRVVGIETKRTNRGLVVSCSPELIEKKLSQMGFDILQLSSLLQQPKKEGHNVF